MEEQKQTKPTLWRLWHQQTWKRRFAVYCGGFVLLIVLFYTIENIRGTMALNAAKQRAADAGIELDFAKLMTREMPPDEENFATCLPAMQEVSQFMNLERELKPLRPHNEHRKALPRYTGIEYAVRDDFSYKFDPQKESHSEGCLAVLSLMDSLTPEFGQISRAAQREHCVWDVDWSKFPMTDFEFLSITRTTTGAFYIRSMAKLGTSDTKGAVADIETLLRIAEQANKKPLLITLLSSGIISSYGTGVIWEGLRNNQFGNEDLNRIQTALNRWEPEGPWNKACVAANADFIFGYSNAFTSPIKRYESSSSPWMQLKYLAGDPLPDFGWDDEAIEFLNRIIFASFPNGWFRQSMAGQIDSNIAIIQSTKTLKEQLTLVDPSHYRNGAYDFIWKGWAENESHQYILQRWINSATKLRLAKTAIAFELHFMKHGNYPTTFETLVPEFLDAVPIDTWTDKPMLLDFRSDGRPVIYSVGEDLDDDGGIPQSRSRPRDGDIVWHYSLPVGFDAKAHYEK